VLKLNNLTVFRVLQQEGDLKAAIKAKEDAVQESQQLAEEYGEDDNFK